MSSLILPGLIDPHVHLRDPGQTEKEDFYTGTSAALAGGYTTILDMPNNKAPITTLARLEEKIAIAKKKIVCDVGFYFGSLGDNLTEFEKVNPPAGGKVFGLKLYLNQTTGNLLIFSLRPLGSTHETLEKIFNSWSQSTTKPILVHAEEKRVEDVISVVRKAKIPTHFCHISKASELKMIINAKEQGLPITCGVTPHHLFLTDHDAKVLRAFGQMKPSLSSKKDQDFLWKNLKYIDVIESDHAPHTIEEKRGEIAPFGVPGLETTLPLLLTAVSQKRLSIDDIVRLCHKNPAKIFGIKTDPQTFVQVDPNWKFEIGNLKFHTKCGWSPFSGMKVKGKVERVFIRGTKVFENGKVLVQPGFGRVLLPHRQ